MEPTTPRPGDGRDWQHRPTLTRREEEVLELLVQGCTNEQIACRLYISVATVERRLTTAFRELGVDSAGGAANRRVRAVLAWLRLTERLKDVS